MLVQCEYVTTLRLAPDRPFLALRMPLSRAS